MLALMYRQYRHATMLRPLSKGDKVYYFTIITKSKFVLGHVGLEYCSNGLEVLPPEEICDGSLYCYYGSDEISCGE